MGGRRHPRANGCLRRPCRRRRPYRYCPCRGCRGGWRRGRRRASTSRRRHAQPGRPRRLRVPGRHRAVVLGAGKAGVAVLPVKARDGVAAGEAQGVQGLVGVARVIEQHSTVCRPDQETNLASHWPAGKQYLAGSHRRAAAAG